MIGRRLTSVLTLLTTAVAATVMADAEVGFAANPMPQTVAAAGASTLALPGAITFPLSTARSVIESQPASARWCFASQANCHHDYNAADIFAPTLTPVISPVAGTVVRATNDSTAPGSRVHIRDEQGNIWYMAHMHHNPGLMVSVGWRVERGNVIGFVGTSVHAVGTPSHLHVDVLPATFSERPSCSGAACSAYPFQPVQALLVAAYPPASTQASAPAIVMYGNEIHVFVARTDRRVFQKRWNPTSGWSDWFDRGGSILGQPEAVVFENRIHLFVTGWDRQLYENVFNPSTGWTNWIARGGQLLGEPSPVIYSNEIHVFVANSADRAVYQLVRNANGTWRGWFPQGGSVNGEVNPVVLGSQLHLFVAGWDRQMYRKEFNPAGGWTQWINHGGQILGMPWAITQNGQIHVFATGVDLRVHQQIYNVNAGGWSTWLDRAGGVTGDPIPLVQDNRLNVFATGTSGHLYQAARSANGTWSAWIDLGGEIVGSAKTFMLGPDVHVFVIGADRRLHQKVWNASSGWSGWHDHGGGIG